MRWQGFARPAVICNIGAAKVKSIIIAHYVWRCLIRRGADVNAEDHLGRRPDDVPLCLGTNDDCHEVILFNRTRRMADLCERIRKVWGFLVYLSVFQSLSLDLDLDIYIAGANQWL